jgi:type IV pilus assembly protein PilA
MNKIINRLRDRKGDEGFTLVELLVVVVIIGILVAIAIPVFLNQREGAWESAVESDLRNAAPIAETYFAENGTYTGITTADFNTTEEVTITVDTATDSGYCFEGTHDNLDATQIFSLDSATGRVTDVACP